jgi:hypothetical protein
VRVAGQVALDEGRELTLTFLNDQVCGIQRNADTSARLDLTPPWVVEIVSGVVTGETAGIEVTLSEPATVTAYFGTDCGAPNRSVASTDMTEQHSIQFDGLSPCTPCYYRLELEDAAHNQAVADNEGICYGVQAVSQSLIADDMEPAASLAWTHGANTGSDDWAVVTTSYAHSAGNAWQTNDVDSIKDVWLALPTVDVAPGAELRFWHTYEFEPGFDGSVLEISTDGGLNWQDLGGAITQGGYNDTLSGSYGNPLGGRDAWSGGAMGTMSQVTVDLSAYEGAGRQVRFRLGCDSSAAGKQWLIDDVEIEAFASCGDDFPGAPTLIAPPAGQQDVPFDAPVALDWGAAANATSYRVFWGADPNAMSLLTETAADAAAIPKTPLKAGTDYYWRVLALGSRGATAGPLWSFRILDVDAGRVADEVVGKTPGLTEDERRAADHDGDSKLNIDDLVKAVKRQE